MPKCAIRETPESLLRPTIAEDGQEHNAKCALEMAHADE